MYADPLVDKPPVLPQYDTQNFIVRTNMIQRRRLLFNYTKKVRLNGYPNTVDLPPAFLPLPPSYSVPLDDHMYEYDLKVPARDAHGILNEKLRNMLSKPIQTLEDYAAAIGTLKPIPTVIQQNKNNLWNWLNDTEFARQRVQGLNPEVIARVTSSMWLQRYAQGGSTPFNLASVISEVNAIIKNRAGTDFGAALNEGSIYVCDYTIFTADAVKYFALSRNRYVAAPIALFYCHPADRQLYPIAIQLNPGISEDNPVFVADGSMDWLLAKIWVNSIDGQHLEFIPHLFESHMVAEAFQISLNRNLGANHPVYQLMHPHFYATLFINEAARGNLMSVDGPINASISVGVPGAAVLIKEHAKKWNFIEHSFVNSLKNRGFDPTASRSQISGYFWQEDGLKLWKIMYDYVKRILDLFYKSEKDLINDFELQQWISEVESPLGGDLKGVAESNGKIVSVEHLAHVITNLFWICTAKHSSGNIQQFNLWGFVPNVPGALYTPPPTRRGTVDKDAILAALPPQAETLSQIAILYLLSDTGAHPPQLVGCTYPGLDKNNEAKTAITAFQQQLLALSKEISIRNQGLVYPYTSLDPNVVANSIYI